MALPWCRHRATGPKPGHRKLILPGSIPPAGKDFPQRDRNAIWTFGNRPPGTLASTGSILRRWPLCLQAGTAHRNKAFVTSTPDAVLAAATAIFKWPNHGCLLPWMKNSINLFSIPRSGKTGRPNVASSYSKRINLLALRLPESPVGDQEPWPATPGDGEPSHLLAGYRPQGAAVAGSPRSDAARCVAATL